MTVQVYIPINSTSLPAHIILLLIHIPITVRWHKLLKVFQKFREVIFPNYFIRPALRVQFSSVQSLSRVWSHELQHARLHCPSPTPGVYSNSCTLRQWHHSTISSSVVPFSSSLQSFPASGSFQMSQFFASGGQSIGVLASTSVLPMNIQDWCPLGYTGWISLPSKGL